MANTVSTSFNLAQIAQQTLDYLATAFMPLTAFTRDFSQDILDKGASVTTRVVSAISAGDLSGGFTASDVTATPVTVTLSNYKGPVFAFTDLEVTKAGSLEWLKQNFMAPAVEGLLAAFFADLLPLITAANFPTAQLTASGSFDADAVVDLATKLTTNKVGFANRSLLIKPSYGGNLQKDNAIQGAINFGGTEVIRQGQIPIIHGFKPYIFNGTIPANGEALEGIAAHPSALAIAARQIATPQNFTGQLENIEDPTTGVPIQLRTWYDHSAGKTMISMGTLYGMSAGVANSLVRITSA